MNSFEQASLRRNAALLVPPRTSLEPFIVLATASCWWRAWRRMRQDSCFDICNRRRRRFSPADLNSSAPRVTSARIECDGNHKVIDTGKHKLIGLARGRAGPMATDENGC